MKISSGKYKGIPLECSKGIEIRPTLAKTRQAIFNMLRPYILGSTVIDCFAGTGAFGLEALSNGAEKVWFIDDSHGKLIKKNAEKAGVLPEKYEIMETDFKKGLKKLYEKKVKADCIFADPPYNKGFIRIFVKLVEVNEVLVKDGLLVLEVHKNEAKELQDIFEEWRMLKDKIYGDVNVFVLQKIGGKNDTC